VSKFLFVPPEKKNLKNSIFFCNVDLNVRLAFTGFLIFTTYWQVFHLVKLFLEHLIDTISYGKE